MGKKKRMIMEAQKEKHVQDVRTMVMYHVLPDGKKEQRCPHCLSRRLFIIDYDVADENEKRFGSFKFIKKCRVCGGRAKHIGNL